MIMIRLDGDNGEPLNLANKRRLRWIIGKVHHWESVLSFGRLFLILLSFSFHSFY